jgi:nicotinamide mononucleotide transporter
MFIFDIENIAIQWLDYRISYVELIATLFGMISVYLASRANIFTWHTGIVNEFFLFLLFFQTQLYADMFLQVYFFVFTLIGWHNWKKQTVANKILTCPRTTRIALVATLAVGTVVAGWLIKNIHIYLPQYFPLPASYPFADSLVMMLSVVATVLLAQKKIESWYLWWIADVVSTLLYFKKEIYFLSLEYFVFLVIAGYGAYNWHKQLKDG